MTLTRFRQALQQARHRALVVLSGERDWCLSQLPELSEDVLWLGENVPAAVTQVTAKKAQQWLGTQSRCLIIDGFDGIDLNALGALSGTLAAGSLCYLLCPSFERWRALPDSQSRRFDAYPEEQSKRPSRWINYLIDIIQADAECVIMEQHQPPRIPLLLPAPGPQESIAPYKTKQQQQAVERIVKVATGHRRRPLVITADRGRGKSSALGLAIAQLLSQGKSQVIVSAPQLSAIEPVFARIQEQFPQFQRSATELTGAQGKVSFIPPDELIRKKHDADIVMIDEAAAIPVPMLTEALQRYSRIVFTSTIHGYEGTGRGFEIRFKRSLNQLTPQWHHFEMDQPIRWAENDPLERLVNRALMMDAEAAQLDDIDIAPDKLVFEQLERDELRKDATRMRQLMGLLILSHYKTHPNDFRHLLDGNNIRVFCASHRGNVVATALVALEGGMDEDLCQAIWQGDRRPKGHLLPQTLGYHSGVVEAPRYRYARIVRIAVHPKVQNQGIGNALLTFIKQYGQDQQLDFLGSSFGATNALLRFWHNAGFSTVRLGITQEATSNEYSAIVLHPLNPRAKSFVLTLHQRFCEEFPTLLTEFYHSLSADAVLELLSRGPKSCQVEPDEHDKGLIEGYLNHKRDYEFCTLALYRHTLMLIARQKLPKLTQMQQQLLVDKVLRKRQWPQICQTLKLDGKRSAQQALKVLFAICG